MVLRWEGKTFCLVLRWVQTYLNHTDRVRDKNLLNNWLRILIMQVIAYWHISKCLICNRLAVTISLLHLIIEIIIPT